LPSRRQLRPLDREVEVNNSIIADVDLPIVIEIAVAIAGDVQRDVKINPAVIGDVDLAVDVRVAGVRVSHDGIAAVDDLPGIGDALDVADLGGGERGEAGGDGAGHARDDAASRPARTRAAAVATRRDQPGDARVRAADQGSQRPGGGDEQLVVLEIELSAPG